MTISEWLMLNMQQLGQAGVDSPRRDALVLLEDVLEKDRSWVLSHTEYALDQPLIDELNKLISRRINREPLAYIRGKAWFYGRFFEVNKNVLIPRPESENFIEIIQNFARGPSSSKSKYKKIKIIDIGTGSGALAITAKLELPSTEVIATDISAEALSVAGKNASNHQVDIKFVQSDLLEKIKDEIDHDTAIVTNLPYVPEDLITSPEIISEPKLALFSGSDGLDHYRQLWEEIAGLKTKPKYVLTESLTQQHKDLETFAKNANYKKEKTDLLIQYFTLSQ